MTTKMHYPIYKSMQKNDIINSQINCNLKVRCDYEKKDFNNFIDNIDSII